MVFKMLQNVEIDPSSPLFHDNIQNLFVSGLCNPITFICQNSRQKLLPGLLHRDEKIELLLQLCSHSSYHRFISDEDYQWFSANFFHLSSFHFYPHRY